MGRSYTCHGVCEAGYQIVNNFTCEGNRWMRGRWSSEISFELNTDIDECLNNSICGPNGTCTNLIPSYECTCANGYRFNGTTCIGERFTSTLDGQYFMRCIHEFLKILTNVLNLTRTVFLLLGVISLKDARTRWVLSIVLVSMISWWAVNVFVSIAKVHAWSWYVKSDWLVSVNSTGCTNNTCQIGNETICINGTTLMNGTCVGKSK